MHNYPKYQIQQAIEILEAMLQDNAPPLSYEFDKYYEYMKMCWKHKQEQSDALHRLEAKLNKAGINRPIAASER